MTSRRRTRRGDARPFVPRRSALQLPHSRSAEPSACRAHVHALGDRRRAPVRRDLGARSADYGALAGVAAWLPPGRYPRGVRRETQYISRDMRSVVRLGGRFLPGTRCKPRCRRTHHRVEVPHWYLMLLGADPVFRRQGAGTALLAPVLERCDRDGVPAYLETQKEENVAVVPPLRLRGVEEIECGAPPMWAMRCEPADAVYACRENRSRRRCAACARRVGRRVATCSSIARPPVRSR